MRVATSPHDFKLMVAASSKPGQGPEATIDAAAQPPSEPQDHEPSYDSAPPSAPMTVGLGDGQPSAPPPPAPAAPSAPPPGVTY